MYAPCMHVYDYVAAYMSCTVTLQILQPFVLAGSFSTRQPTPFLRMAATKAAPSGSIRQELSGIFGNAMSKAFAGVEVAPYIAQTNDARFGDYQCNNAMALFGKLKGKVGFQQ